MGRSIQSSVNRDKSGEGVTHSDVLFSSLRTVDPEKNGHFQIQVKGFSLSRPEEASVRKLLDDWTLRQQSLFFLPRKTKTLLSIEKKSQSQFSCHLSVKICSKKWTGRGEGSAPLSAVYSAMTDMIPVSIVRSNWSPQPRRGDEYTRNKETVA